MKKLIAFLLIALGLAVPRAGRALVNYDQGQRQIHGVQLLQDWSDPAAYYYLPQFPRLVTAPDGGYELLCMKYIDPAGGTSGGLFHALIEFTLPPEVVQDLEKELQKQVPGARLVGPVPLLQAVDTGEEGVGSFQVVSAVLSDRGDKGFTRSLITSGKAPLMPGSKAVVAAILNQQGATLLWDSLSGGTSDVSVAIHAYYEAAVQGYNARVTADVSTVYTHFSRISNVQKDYTKRQVRKVMDDLQRNGTLKVEVLDRTAGLGIKAAEMEGILGVVTDKLTELMFDSTSGWAADPEREAGVEANQIQGRQERGWFSRTFGGSEDTKYFTDNQYVLKRREDVRHNVFSLNLSKSSTIKVPVDTAGNLGGLYKAMKDDPRYFRIVNLNDPAFELRPVHFQIDGNYLDSFQDSVNFVSVNVRKTYPDGQAAFTKSLHFRSDDVKAGRMVQEIAFPRLGSREADWTQYEYQVRWSLRNGPTVSVPRDQDRWIRTGDPAVALVPPFDKRVVELDADRQLFSQRGMSTAVLEVFTVLGGKEKVKHMATLRATDSDPTGRMAVYHDRETPVALRVTWHSPGRTVRGKLQLLDSDFLFITPPEPPAPPAPNPGGMR